MKVRSEGTIAYHWSDGTRKGMDPWKGLPEQRESKRFRAYV